MHTKSPYMCPRCQIGHLQRGQATFVTCLDNQLLSIPDVAAWSCDICQYREFDVEAVHQIEVLTGALVTPLDTLRTPPRAASSDVPPRGKATV